METIKLDLIPGKKMPSLHASQYDDGRDYHIDLTENRVPYVLDGTETISLTVRKCDNTLVTMDIANTFADKSYIEFRTTEQMNACAGFNYGEITIEKNGTQISSLNFYLQVEGAPDEGGISSQSEINNLARQVHDIVVEELEDNGAEETGYDNTESGLEATNVQDAIDELASQPSVDAYTKQESDEKYATKTELSDKADVSAIPTKTSELQNDSGFAEIDDTEASSSKAYSSEKVESVVEDKADESEVVELSEQVDSAVKKTITDKVITTRYTRTELTGGIIQPNGTVISSSSFGYTSIFPVTAGETVTCKKYYLNNKGELKGGVEGVFGTIVFFADNTQTYTSWGDAWNANKTSFVVPANAKYCQVTVGVIMSGTYTIVDVIQTTANGKTNYYLQQDIFKSPVRYIGSLTANKVQTIGEKICVDNYILSATMKVPQNFSSVKVGGRTEAGYDVALPTVEVTPTQVIVHSNVSDIWDITENHGLTIDDDLQIVIEKNKFDKAKVIIQSCGSRFTINNVNLGLSYYGYAIVSTENVSDVDISLSVCDLYKPVWVCGDSWVTNYDSSWYGQALKLGVTNFLKSGHAGEASVNGLNGLKTLLSMYKPKMIVWLYGMNDADTNDSTPNANWLASVQELETICQEQSIELVLATIPTTPTMNNNAKNVVVISSGYRYVDEVSAMGADNSGNWIDGYQSQDGNHTTEEGAKALLVRVLADVPELASAKSNLNEYSKTEIDNALTLKADKSNTYTKAQVDALVGTLLTASLTAGQTSVTISNNAITSGSMLSVFTDVYGLEPTNVAVTTGSATLTFTAQGVDVHIKVEVK